MPRQYLQGKFKPNNPKKYNGDVNGIFFRSSWELAYFKWLDKTDSVIRWSSEEIVIPYISPLDNKTHRYFPDVCATMKTTSGGIKTFLVEIKPFRETQQPKVPKRKTKNYLTEVTTYLKNQAKWENAKIWAADRNMEFIVVTEKDLFGLK